MSQVVDNVMERLIIIANRWDVVPTAEDLAHIREDVERRHQEGWNEYDLVGFFKNCEDINPYMDEDEACRQMGAIAAKYQRPLTF